MMPHRTRGDPFREILRGWVSSSDGGQATGRVGRGFESSVQRRPRRGGRGSFLLTPRLSAKCLALACFHTDATIHSFVRRSFFRLSLSSSTIDFEGSVGKVAWSSEKRRAICEGSSHRGREERGMGEGEGESYGDASLFSHTRQCILRFRSGRLTPLSVSLPRRESDDDDDDDNDGAGDVDG